MASVSGSESRMRQEKLCLWVQDSGALLSSASVTLVGTVGMGVRKPDFRAGSVPSGRVMASPWASDFSPAKWDQQGPCGVITSIFCECAFLTLVPGIQQVVD